MKSRTHQRFVPITKVEEEADGTLKVYGVASSESQDSDGETITADAMRAALPDYMTFGAIREMHQKVAAGTALEAQVNDDGVTEVVAHVVDAGSVRKVQTKVLKGFSIGGEVTKRNAKDKSIIEGLRLTEISLVDRPANPDARITLVKFDKEGRAIEKGMYDVSRLADLLCSLHYLQQAAESEAVYEGDSSAVPAKLRAVVESTLGILKEMLDEESAELLGVNGATKADGLSAIAAKAEKLATTPHQSLDRVLTEISELAKLHKGAASPGGTVEPKPDELAKVSGELKIATDALAKAENEKKAIAGELETVKAEKVALEKRAVDAEKERDDLSAESIRLVESLKAKGHLKAVSKSDDAVKAEGDKIVKDEKPKDAVDEIKKAFQKPIAVDPRARAAQSAAQ